MAKKEQKQQSEENEGIKLDALRVKLSIEQTAMSCERSLLSYIRTACVFVSLAFTYLKVAVFDQIDTFVIIMFLIGFGFLVFGIVEYVLVMKKTKRMSKKFKREYTDDFSNFEEND